MGADAGTLTDLEQRIVATLETSELLKKVYDHEPQAFDRLPAATIGVPRVQRSRVDEPEDELSRATWTIIWPLRLYLNYKNLGTKNGKKAAIALLGEVGGIIDANQHLQAAGQPLANGIQDVKLEAAQPTLWHEGDEGSRVLGGYECDLAVLINIPNE